jgi:hypothetical protein
LPSASRMDPSMPSSARRILAFGGPYYKGKHQLR